MHQLCMLIKLIFYYKNLLLIPLSQSTMENLARGNDLLDQVSRLLVFLSELGYVRKLGSSEDFAANSVCDDAKRYIEHHLPGKSLVIHEKLVKGLVVYVKHGVQQERIRLRIQSADLRVGNFFSVGSQELEQML